MGQCVIPWCCAWVRAFCRHLRYCAVPVLDVVMVVWLVCLVVITARGLWFGMWLV